MYNCKYPLIIVLLLFVLDRCDSRVDKLNICVTKECYKTGETMAANINFDMDPCKDFYEFACGKWPANNPMPPTEQSWHPFGVATHRIFDILKEILDTKDEKKFINDPAPVKSAKNLYDSCMNEERIEKQGMKPIIKLTELFGGWPLLNPYWTFGEFNWQTMQSRLAFILSYQPILHIDVFNDFKNSSRRVIYVDQPSLVVLRQMLVSPDIYKKQITAYKVFVEKVAALFIKHGGNKFRKMRAEEALGQIKKEIEEMIQFEIDIAKLMSSQEMRRDMKRMYNKMTIRELQDWTDTATLFDSNENHVQPINWLTLINDIFRNANIKIDESETIVVRELDYMYDMAKLLLRTPLKTIANYLNWRVIEEYGNELNMEFRNLQFQFRKIFTGAAEENTRWKECLKSTQSVYGLALGYKYTQLNFDEKSKKSAIVMVDNLLMTLQERINHVSWMDDKTKRSAKEKIESMTKFIGYPDFYTQNISHLDTYYDGYNVVDDFFENILNAKIYFNKKTIMKLREQVDRNEWPRNEPPITVNAFYSPFLNAIVFPAAVLQPPFFSKGRPDALNYGGIGIVIGHEITHGFDDLGRQYDKFGNLAQWWTESTIAQHRNKTKCFVNQYNKFEVPELNEKLFKKVKLNGLLTVGENIADNGGLRQAYLAYKRNIANISKQPYIDNVKEELKFMSSGHRFTSYKAIDVRLPKLEMFSNEQLFFLGFASIWCESQTKESLLHEVLGNVHSPQKFRVLGSVANSPEFSKAFNCPVGSPMNPENKCYLW